jgi:hypothetical protein
MAGLQAWGGPMKMRCLFVLLSSMALVSAAFGEDIDSRLKALEDHSAGQEKKIEEQQKTIDSLKEEIARQKEQEPQQNSQGDSSQLSTKVSGFFGGSFLSNPNISLLLDTFVYSSNLNDKELKIRGIPGYTTQGLEQRNGFNLGTAGHGGELSLFSPVDPYFNLYANIPFTDSGVSLEEIFAVTTALPEGFQVKLGKFKSNFSRLDAQHPHAWDFYDVPLPYRAFLGTEALGGEKGVQLTYLPALPIYLQFGAEVLQGENDLLFGADARSGPHAFSFFVKSSIETTDSSTLYFGPSVVYGRTRNTNIVNGAEFDGSSALYGMEAVWKWKRSSREGLTLQGEYLFLAQQGNLTDNVTDSLRRRQDGFYVQGIYQLDRWRFGARYDMLELFADTFKRADVQQHFDGTPWRATGAVDFNPSEFTRFRLQYAHDRSGRDGRSNDEAILQMIFGIGAHAAHTF